MRKTIAGIVVVLAAGGALAFALLRDEPIEDGVIENGTATDPDEPTPAVETVAEGFDQPWGLDFLPGGDQLVVTQTPGVLSLVDTSSGAADDIEGTPEVDTAGQGGLLDVAIHPEFPESEWLYLTYSATNGGGETTTHLARGGLDVDQQQLTDVEELFVAEPFRGDTDHYGSRVEIGPDGHLFVTIGDRGDKNFDDHPSQETSHTLGTTVRLGLDGSVPEDNPFVDDPAVADEIFTYGHRNVQGMAFHPDSGQLWQSEHGEGDGDEINVIEAGTNYGWPETHTGCEYGTDTPVGEDLAERDDITGPVHAWECGTGGFPPAGIAFYAGDQFPAWDGDLFVSGLAGDGLARFTTGDSEVEHVETLLTEEGWRIRDVAPGPDGALYLAIDDDDTPLVRLVDANG